METYQVKWTYTRGMWSSTQFGSKEDAEQFAASLRKRGAKCVTVSKV